MALADTRQQREAMYRFSAFQGKIGVVFRDKSLLLEALTHRSYLNENPNWRVRHNEVLEFLGDAVLELVVTDHLCDSMPEMAEGELTRIRSSLVSINMLSTVARELEMSAIMWVSRGTPRDGERAWSFILGNAFESLVGAIYKDQGYVIVQGFIERFLFPHLEEVLDYKDPKSLLQERVQEILSVTPTYELLRREGSDHEPLFTIGVYFGDVHAGTGKGSSMKEAEVNAAESALEARRWL